jgi:hypothetical protein
MIFPSTSAALVPANGSFGLSIPGLRGWREALAHTASLPGKTTRAIVAKFINPNKATMANLIDMV